jgi:hypothetical protein
MKTLYYCRDMKASFIQRTSFHIGRMSSNPNRISCTGSSQAAVPISMMRHMPTIKTELYQSNIAPLKPQTSIHANMPLLIRKQMVSCRFFAIMPDDEMNRRLNGFQDSFVVARDCIEDVLDTDKDDEYFEDNVTFAKDSVAAAIEDFNSILNDLDDPDQRNRVLRSNGLKVKQLEGELEMALKGGHKDD